MAMPFSAQAAASVVGVHVRLKGTFPPAGEVAQVQLARARETCALIGMQFRFSGRLEDVGKAVFDDYYSVEPRMTSSRVKSHVLEAKSACEFEVRESETWKIRHYSNTGYTDFELKNDRRKGAYWQSSEHRALDPSVALPLIKGSVLRETTAAVGLGQKSYAGHTCEMSNVSLNKEIGSTSCLHVTGLPFPKEVDLAGRLVGRDMVLLEKEATEARINVALPAAHFYPPAGAEVIGIESRSRAGANSTQAWCRAQKQKPGTSPCEDGPDDD